MIADVALEECLKATHKRQDACHIFIVPRLLTPTWRRLFRKLCDFVVIMPVGHPFWPTHMHEPLFLGVSLPFVHHRPWSLRGTPLLVALERDLRQVWASSEKDGRDIRWVMRFKSTARFKWVGIWRSHEGSHKLSLKVLEMRRPVARGTYIG